MSQPGHLRFGTFIPPIHPNWENPTLSMERDMQLIVHLDTLGFDEAWIGEHHSAGAEVIASPELIIAAVAERTKRIKLGTGVSSLPYHHPLILADRLLQLHHMTRGRAMLGCGPGALVSDAMMMGLNPERQRDMMEESLDCIVRLFRGETVTKKTDWFELKDARLQIAPYGGEMIEIATACVVSPSGPRAAGKFGTGLMSLGGTSPENLAAAPAHWQTANDMAAKHGNTMNRKDWRMVCAVHVAETREQAFEQVKFGLQDWVDYFGDVATHPMVPKDVAGDPAGHLTRTGRVVIGSPDDCIRQIERLVEATGGFGCFLITDTNWARFEDKLKSYELVARYVFPAFQNLTGGLKASRQWVAEAHDGFQGKALAAQQAQILRHAAEKAAADTAKGKAAE